jgi:hypothetical protein
MEISSCASGRAIDIEARITTKEVTTMIDALHELDVTDDDPVTAEQIPLALTAGNFVYDDGATQVFEANGDTAYVEDGRVTRGRWHVDDKGHFCSFWPPDYQACYDLRWIVERGSIVGLRFTELRRGTRLNGRYR